MSQVMIDGEKLDWLGAWFDQLTTSTAIRWGESKLVFSAAISDWPLWAGIMAILCSYAFGFIANRIAQDELRFPTKELLEN